MPEGPDCQFPKELVGFGPIPARIRGFVTFILALRTARTSMPWTPYGWPTGPPPRLRKSTVSFGLSDDIWGVRGRLSRLIWGIPEVPARIQRYMFLVASKSQPGQVCAAGCPNPYEFLGFGGMHVTKPYKSIWFGDIHGPKPYIFIGIRASACPKLR